MNMLGKILYVANGAYESGAMQLTVNYPPGIRGDSLADFIAAELRGVCTDWADNDEFAPRVALASMDTAIQELEAVRAAIEELT